MKSTGVTALVISLFCSRPKMSRNHGNADCTDMGGRTCLFRWLVLKETRSGADLAYDLLICHWEQEEGRKDCAVVLGSGTTHQPLKS